VIEPEGADKKLLRVTLPLGMQVPPGTRVIIDQGQPATGPYVICFTNGCMADYEVNADIIGRLKKGQQLAVQAINGNGQPVSLTLPLNDFAKAMTVRPRIRRCSKRRRRSCRKSCRRRPKRLARSCRAAGRAPADAGKTQ
jgi:invasion protein IalB